MQDDASAAMPLLVGYDFGQAFPSLAHSWVLKVLNAMLLPPPLVTFTEFLFSGVCCYGALGTDLTLLFWISSGIIQGCPSSGCIFALAADPFTSNFDASICCKDRGVVRACADDVGAVLRRLEHLRVMH
eukprot:2047620-Pyramimonas_sp.AAC.1